MADFADCPAVALWPCAPEATADAGVRPVGMDRQQQALGEDLGADAAVGRHGCDGIQAAGSQHGLLEHVDERDGAPAPQNLGHLPMQLADELRWVLRRAQRATTP